jgi:hypothetical protein
VQTTVVTPIENADPDGGVHDTTAPGKLSETTGAGYVTVGEHCPAGDCTTTLGGQVSNGAWVSVTVTVKLHDARFPAASVAVHETLVEPIPKTDPGGGVQTSNL